jgi:hypothetical protein
MIFSKESRQSAQVFPHVLKLPLYDGDCSPAARELLAAGDVDGALAEWRRLADLGSGRARCVLAYVATVEFKKGFMLNFISSIGTHDFQKRISVRPVFPGRAPHGARAR